MGEINSYLEPFRVRTTFMEREAEVGGTTVFYYIYLKKVQALSVVKIRQ